MPLTTSHKLKSSMLLGFSHSSYPAITPQTPPPPVLLLFSLNLCLSSLPHHLSPLSSLSSATSASPLHLSLLSSVMEGDLICSCCIKLSFGLNGSACWLIDHSDGLRLVPLVYTPDRSLLTQPPCPCPLCNLSFWFLYISDSFFSLWLSGHVSSVVFVGGV